MKKLALIALAALATAHAAPTRTATEGYVDRTVSAATNGLATAEDLGDYLPLTGGTLTGDLAVGEAFAGSRTLSIASDNGAAGITLKGGTSYGNGSILTIGGSSVGGATLYVNGGEMRGGYVIVGASTGGGGILEVQGSDASIKKDGKEVATEDEIPAVVEPSESATEGQAADANAVFKALAGKVDNIDGLIRNSLTVGPQGAQVHIADGKINYSYFYGEGVNLVVLTLPKKDGIFALTSDIESATENKADATNVYTKAEVDAKVENAVLPTDPTFSNAVLAVGLNIDTNSVAVLNDIAKTFGGFPIEGTATTVGGLLAALAAAVAWLKRNKADKTDVDELSKKVDAANAALEEVA